MSYLFASKYILVDLTHQVAIAYQDGKVKFYGRVSTGKPGRRTPTGSFYVREKDIDHVSNLWPQPNGGAKMHYMLRITRDGIAMHLGPTPDYPASHGCIRMKDGFAQKMFAWAQKWTRVDIVGTPPDHSPPVTLPAFATSPEILRRSIGAGMMHASRIINTNPKMHQKPTGAAQTPPEHKPRHLNPLKAISTNPKDHLQTAKLAKSKTSSSAKKKNRHPDPLKAVSAH